MIALINRVTGTTMYVSEDRVAEYLAAGHKLETVVKKAEMPKTATKKTATKKTTKKK